jgi:hypothetical protein
MTQVLDGSGTTLLQGVLARVERCADDMPLGTVSVEADGVPTRPGDDDNSLHRDLVVWGADSGTPGCTTSGDTVSSLGSSGAMSPGLAGLLLPGYPDSSFPPINWGQVEISVEQACSQVEVTKRIL